MNVLLTVDDFGIIVQTVLVVSLNFVVGIFFPEFGVSVDARFDTAVLKRST